MPVSKITKVAASIPLLLAASALFTALPTLRSTFATRPVSACRAWNGAQPSTPQASVIGVATLPSCQVLAIGNVLGPNNFNALAMRFGGAKWMPEATPAPGVSSSLNSVAVTSDTNGWAVGTYAAHHVTHALIEHWTGTSWVRQAVPQPGGAKRSTSLFGVAGNAASGAWAVGNYRAPDNHLRTLILRWNGRVWRPVASPNPGGAGRDDRLTSVSSISAKDAWAVGYYQDGKSARRVLVLHWDGTAWRQVPTPYLGESRGSMLFAVTAISTSDVWAVGYLFDPVPRTLVLYWNGGTWTRQAAPNPDQSGDILSGVAGTSASDVWAVGHSNSGTGQTTGLILHWNGLTWTQLASPTPDRGDYARLIAVTESSTDSVWAVGAYRTPNGYAQGLFLYWNGRSWRA